MATGTYAPCVDQRVVDSNGTPVSGGLVWTYLAGTSTTVSTYTEVTLTTPNTNPIIAGSDGRYVAFLTPGISYKFVEEQAATPPAHGAVIITRDNISAVPTTAGNIDETGTAGEALTANQAVYLSDGSGGKTAGQWFKADSANPYSSTLPSVGFVPANIAISASGTIRRGGNLGSFSALTVGARYYVGSAGAITTTAPANARTVGQADTASTLDIGPYAPTAPAVNPATCNGRLTLTTATPVTTADVTAAGTLYFTPYAGNQIALYDGTNWLLRTLTEISLALTATSGKPYDVFVYDNAGTPTLETLVWTNDTTRATALTTQNGVLVKTGVTTRRYIGSFYASGANTTEDSFAKRYLWNYYNRVPRVMRLLEATDNWAYNGVFRQARATAANQLDFIIGVAEIGVEGYVIANASGNAGSTDALVAIGEDSTTTADPGCLVGKILTQNNGNPNSPTAQLKKYTAVGRHVWVWLEKAGGAITTWYGDNAGDGTQSGIHGVLLG